MYGTVCKEHVCLACHSVTQIVSLSSQLGTAVLLRASSQGLGGEEVSGGSHPAAQSSLSHVLWCMVYVYMCPVDRGLEELNTVLTPKSGTV